MKKIELIRKGLYTGLMAANFAFGPLIVFAGHESYSRSYQLMYENKENQPVYSDDEIIPQRWSGLACIVLSSGMFTGGAISLVSHLNKRE